MNRDAGMNIPLHSRELMIDTEEESFVVYADFNCPFCYALHERLIALDLLDSVSFRNVQHAPGASSSQVGFETISKLAGEVAEVDRRAPSTDIYIPMFIPNSGPATSLVCRVSRIDRMEGRRLRTAIYRALWVDGIDISNPEYLESLVHELDIEVPPETAADIDELIKWQQAWDSNDEFERKIPILIGASGETVVGFPLEQEVDAFLKTGSLVSDKVLHGSSSHQKKQSILVLDDDVTSLKMIIREMHECRVEVAKDTRSLLALVSERSMPDLVIINMSLIDYSETRDWWRDTTDLDIVTPVPVIFVADDNTNEVEVAAFGAGAVEFIAKPYHPEILKARLNRQLQVRGSQEQLNNIARIDSLTSLCNRREFDMRLLTEWRRSARSQLQLSLLMIDIDNFKEYNDNYGHVRGDDCLTWVAQTLSDCMQRSADTLARYGGEEFVALLPESELEGAINVAQKCLDAIRKENIPHKTSPVKPYITLSIGVATIKPVHKGSMTVLVERADIALFEAKKKGRDQLYVFENEA